MAGLERAQDTLRAEYDACADAAARRQQALEEEAAGLRERVRDEASRVQQQLQQLQAERAAAAAARAAAVALLDSETGVLVAGIEAHVLALEDFFAHATDMVRVRVLFEAIPDRAVFATCSDR